MRRRTTAWLGAAALLLAALLSACLDEFADPAPVIPTSAAPAQTQPALGDAPLSEPADWLSVYFTEPEAAYARSRRGGIDQYLEEAIAAARVSIEVAIYDLNLWSIRDALLAAHAAGVEVRLVVESDQLDRQELQELIDAGIPVLGDRREGLMHNKFVIIDRQEVWTGSLNFTVNGAYDNHNNLLRLRSARLAENYLAEFEEMFTADEFGPGSPADTPHPLLTISGVQVETYFSPDDGVLERLVELVDSAEHSVVFMAFSFTSDPLADALLARAEAGVTVAGVFDRSQAGSNTGGEFEFLQSAGLDVRLDNNPEDMHHKVLIIDEQIVVAGSYNFSNNAETRNDENVLVIYDPWLAAQYLAEFERIFAAASPE